MKEAFNKEITEVLNGLQTDKQVGLSSTEVEFRLEKDGENKLSGKKQKTLVAMFLEQFKNVLLIILVVAGLTSFALGERLEATAILLIIFLNCILGVYQENKASNALNALKEMATPSAKVIRNSKIIEVSSKEIVVGDIVLLDAGDSVCADLRLIESTSLEINEATLTGESNSSAKDAFVVLDENTQIGDMVNCAFMDTVVTSGRGVGVVIATGMNTQIGKIADMIINVEDELTPLQKKLDILGKKLGIGCMILCILIFVIGLLRGMEVFEIFMISVSLAVAAIPSGLTIVVTVILAIGMQKMVKSNALIKTLGAVETLGSSTIICSDKTGTLTQNKMTVIKVYDLKNTYDVKNEIVNMTELNEVTKKLITGIVLCNDSTVDKDKVIGDPTEGALVALGIKIGIIKEELNLRYPRVNEIPFDSTRKLMSTLHKSDSDYIMFTKGASDEVLSRSKYIYDGGKVRDITQEDILKIKKCNEEYAHSALRVLGLAYKNTKTTQPTEDDLIFVGLVGMIDPPREEVKDAIVLCKNASINVKMITGDHKITATAIGKQLGIVSNIEEAIEGYELDLLNDEELKSCVLEKNVFARVSPEHKVRLVKVMKELGNIVAMTGDGVNDAPSLKQADIGIAMGITGTDVSKEAADMILTDDNFSSIVKAVEEGRTIYGNIKKVVAYLLSCNIGEIMIIFVAMLLGLPIPLGAIQLISINIVTDTFPSFALGMEKKENDVMNIPPRKSNENIVDRSMITKIIIQSISLTVGALASFMIAYYYIDPSIASTFCFVTLVLGELLRAYSTRSEKTSIFKTKAFDNAYLNKTVLVSFTFLILSVYVPVFNTAFGMQALSFPYFIMASAFSLVPFIGGELSKKLR